MEIFNNCISDVEKILSGIPALQWDYDPTQCWETTDRSELIMLREAAFELGGSGKPALSFHCFTTDERFVPGDSVRLYGPDLSLLKADTAFARIVLISTQDVGEDDAAYRALQDIEFYRYHVFPTGYMVRALSEDSREQVRVSRSAVRAGISFRTVGYDYIREYKKDPNVRSVQVLFVTDPDADHTALKKTGKTASDITRSLNTILEGLPTDCDSCGLREICDEVEGMRELHFQRSGKDHDR